MIFYECLRVQASQHFWEDEKSSSWSLIRAELDQLPPGQCHVVTRIDQPGEVMVLLRWEQAKFDPNGSRLAQVLLSELRRQGLVNHSVWVESAG